MKRARGGAHTPRLTTKINPIARQCSARFAPRLGGGVFVSTITLFAAFSAAQQASAATADANADWRFLPELTPGAGSASGAFLRTDGCRP
ncbi:MAG: hypothetical protein AAF360_10200 [Pseudomonadota bacterium]